jgi:hypothetical protein
MKTILFCPLGNPGGSREPEPDNILYQFADLNRAIEFLAAQWSVLLNPCSIQDAEPLRISPEHFALNCVMIQTRWTRSSIANIA